MCTASSVLIAAAFALAACSSTGTTSAVDEVTTTVAVTAPSAAVTSATSKPGDTAAPAPDTTDTPEMPDSTAAAVGATRREPSSTWYTVAASPDRPFDVFVPSSYDGDSAVPLVLLLHGYGASGDIQEGYFGLQPLAEERGFLYVHPDGTVDGSGRPFWNATDACCDEFAARTDDSQYLFDVIEQVEANYRVDTERIFIVGHSNGGFMSYRMACDHADIIAAIVSVAGATLADTSRCAPSNPVSVLEIHGAADPVIAYNGGERNGHAFPSAVATTQTWAVYDGCGQPPVLSTTTLDLTTDVDGAETAVVSYGGCSAGVEVELWTVVGGQHVPNLSAGFAPAVIDFLLAHPKSS